jgi:cytochrome P450
MAYFPFAAGSRQCIGEGLAWMEGVLALATIAQRWRLVSGPGQTTPIRISPAISLRPKDPVLLRVDRR